MFDRRGGRDRGAGQPGADPAATSPSCPPAAPPAPAPLTAADVASWREALASVDRDVSDADRIDQLRVLEELKAAAAAAQARIAVDLDRSQRHAQEAAGVPAARRGQGVGAQVALARRESAHQGGRLLGLAKTLVLEMPHTFAALQAGTLSEWRATVLVREAICLSAPDRAAFDAELWADPAAVERTGTRALVARAKQLASRLDAASVVARARRAEAERGVSLRPAPDTMTYLTGLLPVAEGVGVWAALTRVADALRAQGDGRSRGQIMADTLVERVTGQARAADVPIEVQLVMTDRTLLEGDAEPAVIPGYGTVPAGFARDLITDRLGPLEVGGGDGVSGARDSGAESGAAGAGDSTAPGVADRKVLAWVRRLFTAPGTGELVALDSRRRIAPPGLARFVTIRDQACRTTWCDAPIRHRDHVVSAAAGGPTTAANLRGACEACNYARQAPGWTARTLPTSEDAATAGTVDGATDDQRAGPGRHVVELTTPTGHTYTSHAPPLPGHRPTRPTAPPGRQRLPSADIAGAPPGLRVSDSVLERRMRADFDWIA
ncbi:DUF222 domain-containing protein [Georgenia thermotolerans]|uniref:DUF222 domain-containing protein n=1 Tax=Georgenia thermotolerans TaxID=527326 RepID=A0A7J5UTI1_9MICO|nr:DUF222 domain-containing protein [Georgenia thermotolerans]KAE8765580.1 DUF222 domain-containing protein [Georgenia thermotolerans]